MYIGMSFFFFFNGMVCHLLLFLDRYIFDLLLSIFFSFERWIYLYIFKLYIIKKNSYAIDIQFSSLLVPEQLVCLVQYYAINKESWLFSLIIFLCNHEGLVMASLSELIQLFPRSLKQKHQLELGFDNIVLEGHSKI